MSVNGTRQLVDSVPSLVDVALDHIRTRIVTGEFPPGHRLKERELTEETGISRIPIREAIRALASEGFVTLVPRRGAVVTELRPDLLDEIFEVREALEVQECVLAAQRASREDVELMRQCVDAAESAARSGDAEAVNAANARFHEILVDASHNDILAGVLRPLKNRLNWILRQNDDVGLVCSEHREILEAIAAGDVEHARAVATSHVQTSKQLALSVLFQDRPEAVGS